MRIEEASFIGDELLKIYHQAPFKTVLNLGAGNVERLLVSKPWVNLSIFQPVADLGVRIVHTDIQKYPGVDFVLDLTKDQDVKKIAGQFAKKKVVLLCNVLEHIPTNRIPSVISGISELLASGDHLIVSVPFQYPYHPDPIDTMFRPHPNHLAAMFESVEFVRGQIVTSGTYSDELKRMSCFKRCRRLLRPILPVSAPKRYLSDLHRLSFLLRPYKISVAIFCKV